VNFSTLVTGLLVSQIIFIYAIKKNDLAALLMLCGAVIILQWAQEIGRQSPM
jgi:hypothetical protein